MVDTDDEYRMWLAWKYDSEWNVRPGWDSEAWHRWYWEHVKPFGTRNCYTTNRLEMNDDFRIRAVKRAVSAGKQDPRDLDDVRRNGVVTNPTESLSRSMAREYSVLVDAGKRSKKEL